jgi:hypothetical protein
MVLANELLLGSTTSRRDFVGTLRPERDPLRPENELVLLTPTVDFVSSGSSGGEPFLLIRRGAEANKELLRATFCSLRAVVSTTS